MTDIYTPEGTLDYQAAAELVRRTEGMASGPLVEAHLKRATAAALLDIAVSLGHLVQGLATGGVWLDGNDDDTEREVGPDGAPLSDEEREGDPDPVDELEVGDWVEAIDEQTAAEWGRGQVAAAGESEGTAWVTVDGWPEAGKVWAGRVRKVDGPIDEAAIANGSLDAEAADREETDDERAARKAAKKAAKALKAGAVD